MKFDFSGWGFAFQRIHSNGIIECRGVKPDGVRIKGCAEHQVAVDHLGVYPFFNVIIKLLFLVLL